MKLSIQELLKEANAETSYDIVGDLLSYNEYEGETLLECVETCLDEFDDLDDNGQVHEAIDGMIDIYTSDLMEWNAKNYNYVDDAIDEGLCEPGDMVQMIQSGQYVKYSQDAYQELEDIKSDLEDLQEKLSEEDNEDYQEYDTNKEKEIGERG